MDAINGESRNVPCVAVLLGYEGSEEVKASRGEGESSGKRIRKKFESEAGSDLRSGTE